MDDTEFKKHIQNVFGNSIQDEQDYIQQMLNTAPPEVPQDILNMLTKRYKENEKTLKNLEP